MPSITAQGTGKVTGIPDVLSVSLAIHTEGDTANGTLQENSLRTQQMLDATKEAGVDPKDVQTVNVSVGPRFDFTNPNRPRIIGYSADNSFVVKLRDLTKAGSTIDGLSSLAGDFLQVQGIGYSIDDSTELLTTARADAVQRAATQAKQLADAAGVTLGPVRSITEVPQNTGPFPTALAASGAASDQASIPVPFAPGSEQLSLTVTVVYDIG
ncbi:MAG: uncharacterized protein QOI82_1797 [Actinomycetota bacterium]|nr:uncharacterized protein [Actinomycetota bacterium]